MASTLTDDFRKPVRPDDRDDVPILRTRAAYDETLVTRIDQLIEECGG